MMTWNFARRLVGLVGMGLLTLGLVLPAAPVGAAQVAYFPSTDHRGLTDDRSIGGLLIDWLDATRKRVATRARVVNPIGAQSGSVTGDATELVVTLDSPISETFYANDLDSCGEVQPLLRRDTTRMVVRDVSGGTHKGTSQILEFGTVTTLDGCDANTGVPFGSLADSGVTMNRVAMNARPSVRDLTPGTQLAGFSEHPWLPEDPSVAAADVVTLYAGDMALFAASGRVVPAAFNAEEWLVFSFGAFERAYARLAVDKAHGGETWLRAEWSGGQAQRVFVDLVVKPTAGAGFPTERHATRMWESGIASTSQLQFFIDLYRGGTGERVLKDLAAGTENRTPITWVFAGKNILQTRFTGGNFVIRRDRTWVPLHNSGKLRYVMESETQTFPDGTTRLLIVPRVNFYIDTGKAVSPVAPSVP